MKMGDLVMISAIIIGVICPLVSNNRIIGGAPADEGVAPYHVSIQNLRGSHVCGGAIISNRAVVSAAHCFVNASSQHIFLVVGTNDLSMNGDRYNVSNVIIHPEHDDESKENDIALLFTFEDIIFTDLVQPVTILDEFIESDIDLIFTGFGWVTIPGNSSKTLQIIELKSFNFSVCQYAYRNIRPLFSSQLCTFNGVGNGACYGDSGGPLVYNSSLVGLSSFGVPCAVGFPDVFTRTADFIPWIKLHVSIASNLYGGVYIMN